MADSKTDYLSLRKAAARIGIHHATLSRAVKRGEVTPEFVTPGGFMRFTEPQIDEYRQKRLQYGDGRIAEQPSAQEIYGIANGIGSGAAKEVLESIPSLARSLANAEYAALAVMDNSGHVERFITSGISEEVRMSIGDPPAGRGLLGVLHKQRKAIRIPDIARSPDAVGYPANHPKMKAMLGVPILLGEVSLGNLYLTNKIGADEFSERDQEVMEAFARYAAIAIESSNLYARESLLRRQAEQEQRRLRAIIESSAAAVVVVDAPDGLIVLANQEAERILGRRLVQGQGRQRYEQAAVYRRPNGSIFSPDELPLQRALSDGVVSRGVEVVLSFSDGREIPTIVNAAPVYGENGEVTAAITVFEDITALQEVERLKAEFLSMISHDLKGPLSTIKGLASTLMLEKGPRDIDTLLEYVASIDEEADEMTELVGNLLDMSRIEAGSMPLDPEQCHLADITGDCIKRVARSRLGGRHDITVDVALELPEVFVDYDQVCRVLSNLLSNSIKYSQPGSEITVRSYLMPSNAGRIVTEVGDSGVGIPDNEIDKIFDKFYRVTSQRGRGRPGSGLGLAICKSIIEAHDGKIWVDSIPGRGSTFYFDLPVSIPRVAI